jgi:hypothetical protein
MSFLSAAFNQALSWWVKQFFPQLPKPLDDFLIRNPRLKKAIGVFGTFALFVGAQESPEKSPHSEMPVSTPPQPPVKVDAPLPLPSVNPKQLQPQPPVKLGPPPPIQPPVRLDPPPPVQPPVRLDPPPHPRASANPKVHFDGEPADTDGTQPYYAPEPLDPTARRLDR